MANLTSSILCDTSRDHPRPVVPTSLRRRLFHMFHDLAHPGIRASRRLLTARFVWKGINHDVGHWARSCLPCQRAKVHRHTKAPLTAFPLVDRRFSTVHVDVVGPLPPSGGFTGLLTVVDCFTRWCEAIPIADATTSTCARAFLHHWISRFGVPARMISNQGKQFTSHLWAELCSLLGTAHHCTTAYHPQANGMVEQFH